MNISQPKQPPAPHRAQRGAGVQSRTEPKRGSATLKNFFSLKFSRSVCADVVGIALRGRVVDEVLVVENM